MTIHYGRVNEGNRVDGRVEGPMSREYVESVVSSSQASGAMSRGGATIVAGRCGSLQ